MNTPKTPRKSREDKKRDTLYWCGLIKAQSGLSDAQIEVKLDLVDDPNGRNFNRWLTGERTMSQDQVQIVVKKAREVDLLSPSPRKRLGTHAEFALEQRAGEHSPNRASDDIQKTLRTVRDLHKAKKALMKVALAFQHSVAAAEKVGVDVFDMISNAPDGGFEAMLETTEIQSISERVGGIASWYFLNGQAYSINQK